ncbi:hypothetical protein HDU98_003327 [Podochytrium sp. JEL0797]|nr:hypothetical protein HDU98_003327 [Podochytrium sp. JEL0797]
MRFAAPLTLLLAPLASAYIETLTPLDSSVCVGVLGGSVVKLQMASVAQTPALTSVLVYSYLDEQRFVNPNTQRAELCGPGKYCAGQFIVQDSVPFQHRYLNTAASFNSSHSADVWRQSFTFDDTGLYCIVAETNTPDEITPIYFALDASFEAFYGKLPASDYPKLGLFLGLSIVYLVIGAIWSYRTWMFYDDILQLQHFISGVTFFLMVEMAFNYGYYEEYNVAGSPSSFLLVMVVILNAARNSVSFFMLLIVALGYGVVKPTLGANMKKCVILGVVHFLCGVLYGAGSLVVNQISASFALMFSLPLSFAMTAFYYSILNGLTSTMQNLKDRRQPIKLLMYQRLWRILVFSAVVLFAFFIVNTIAFKNRFEPGYIQTYWQYRWLLLDGWLNILYLVIYLSIALLWRPTENNQRYGLEQLASDDFDDDEELMRNGGNGGISNRMQRKVHVRAMNTAGTDETLEFGDEFGDEEDEDEEEADEDVFRWAEENVGGDGMVLHQQQQQVQQQGMVRDSSAAGLLDEEDEDSRNH